MIGYALTGSFCTLRRSIAVLERLIGEGYDVQAFASDNAYLTDTRFGAAAELMGRVETLTGRSIVHSVREAEPFGPVTPLEALVIAPCTGNTLARLASGITDGAVTMAAKAHLRQDRPLLLALASNDAMSQNLGNIARLLTRRSVYLVPMLQDDPVGKPYSLVAEMEMIPECLSLALRGVQTRPLFLTMDRHGG